MLVPEWKLTRRGVASPQHTYGCESIGKDLKDYFNKILLQSVLSCQSHTAAQLWFSLTFCWKWKIPWAHLLMQSQTSIKSKAFRRGKCRMVFLHAGIWWERTQQPVEQKPCWRLGPAEWSSGDNDSIIIDRGGGGISLYSAFLLELSFLKAEWEHPMACWSWLIRTDALK